MAPPSRSTASPTLTMEPIGGASAKEDEEGQKRVDAAELSDIDSEWVVLEKSDAGPVQPAAAAGGGGLGFLPLPVVPLWAKWVLGSVIYIAVPFYKRARKIEGEAVQNAETAVEVVERVAEVTEKLASNVADSLPDKAALRQAAIKVEVFAEEVDKDAQKAEDIIKKIDEVSDEIDAALEPIIEKLDNDFRGQKTSNGVSNDQK